MRHPSIVLLLFVCMQAYSQSDIIIGQTDTLYSRILQEKRAIKIHLPNTEPDPFCMHPRYPVVYVLDDDFLPTVAITENLSGGSGNFTYPKMIVVSIGNTDRTRDFTPVRSTDGSVMPAFLLETSGGGEAFNAFLQQELIPYIEQHHPAAPYRVLIGHSFGGLSAISNLIRPNSAFNAFIAIDPSMWWDGQRYLQTVKTALQNGRFDRKYLYVAIANTLPPGLSLEAAPADTAPFSLPIRSILELDRFVQSVETNGLQYRSKFYAAYDHGGIPLVAKNDGLPYVFGFYGVNFPFPGFFEPSFANDDTLVNHYNHVSDIMGYTVAPPGELINAIAHQLDDMQQTKRAEKYYRLNVRNYPDSPAPYIALAEHYAARGNKPEAIRLYRLSLDIQDNPAIRQQIEHLRQ